MFLGLSIITLLPFIPLSVQSNCFKFSGFSSSQCPSQPDTPRPWWHSLRISTPNKTDPSTLQVGNCSLEYQNLLAACIACNWFSNDTSPPTTHAFINQLNNHTLHFLSHNCTASLPSQFSSHLPRWVHNRYYPIFDPFEAVELALPASPSTMTIPSPPVPSTSVSSHPTTSAPLSSPKAATSNAGPIAGGVIGGVLFLSLVVIVVLYYRRWRNRQRVAPSAEFMYLSGSNGSYARALNDSPQPPVYMMQNNLNDSVLEKAYRSAEAQRRLDSQDSSQATWENHV